MEEESDEQLLLRAKFEKLLRENDWKNLRRDKDGEYEDRDVKNCWACFIKGWRIANDAIPKKDF